MSKRSLPPFLLAMLMLGACGSDPADTQPAVDPEDRRLGAEQHAMLLEEFGGSYSGPEAGYMARVGGKVASAAGLDELCTFSLVNSDVVNAFAVPGCYIYVTRGLLAYVNSEAEMAAVLAHEVGHIVADHAERQESRSVLRQIGVMAVGVLTGSETLTRMAGEAAAFFTLSYSRKQEYEADDLSIRFLMASGYDPFEAADMLDAIARHEQFLSRTRGQEDAKSMPEWTQTHPLTANRIERALDGAKDTGRTDNELPERVDPFLTELDGLLYGDDPQQGFVIGRRFAHPVMRIGFEAPPGFHLTNSPAAILLDGPDGLRGEFGGGQLPGGSLDNYVRLLLEQLLGLAPAEIGQPERRIVNGLPMLEVPVQVHTEKGSVLLVVAAYAAPGNAAYHFVVAPGIGGAPASLDGMFGSFRILSEREVRSLRPRMIRVVTARSGDTLEAVAAGMASENPMDLFLMLNDRRAGRALRPGERVKIVTYAGGE